MLRRIAVVPLVALMALLLAPPAWADYSTDVAGRLSAQNHIYIDPGADPKLPNAQTLNEQIEITGVPLWIINIAEASTDDRAVDHADLATDPIKDALDATHNRITNDIQVNGQPHKPPLILLVIDANGYHAWSYNVTAAVANSTEPKIVEAASHHHKDLEGTVAEYISLMAAIPGHDEPGDTSATAAETTAVPSFDTLFLWVLGLGLAVGALRCIFVFARWIVGRHEETASAQNRIVSDITSLERRINNLAHEVLDGHDVSQQHTDAVLSLASARKALREDKYTLATVHLKQTEHSLDAADRTLLEPQKPNLGTVKAMTRQGRKPERSTISATDKAGNAVKIDNGDYKVLSRKGYRHYYQGGQRDGVDFYPGYYPFVITDCSWNANDVTTTGAPLGDWSGEHTGGTSALLCEGSSGGPANVTTPSPSDSPSHGSSTSHNSSHSTSSWSGGSSTGDSSSFSAGFSCGGGCGGGGSAGF